LRDAEAHDHQLLRGNHEDAPAERARGEERIFGEVMARGEGISAYNARRPPAFTGK
jgi:hypothetical protein